MTITQRSSLALLTTAQLENVVRDARTLAREAKAEEGANSIGHRARLEYLRGCLEELATRSNATELVTL